MFGSLIQITIREWRRHKLRFALTILGISLGVAVFFAIQTTNKTLVNSLHNTIEKLAGKATLQIVAGESGFTKAILDRVRSTPGVQFAEPVTETVATTAFGSGQKLLILGLDTASDLTIYDDTFDKTGIMVKNPLAFVNGKDSVAVTQTMADRFGLKDGAKIVVNVQSGPVELTVRGIFRSAGIGDVYGGNVAVMDIYAAQDVFGRGTNIDRIDVSNLPSVSVNELQMRLTEWLPSGIKAVRPNLRGQSLENAVSSMNFGLTIMSFLALTIGVFIIFNSFSISLNQRWKEIGILRALGVERWNVQRMFLYEAAMLGVMGSAIGVAGGMVLATGAIRLMGGVTASFYGIISSPSALEFSPIYAAEAFGAGLIASLIAAWVPSRAAARLDPIHALHNNESRQRESGLSRTRIAFGFALTIAGVLLTRFSTGAVGANFQLLYSFILQLGLILLVPLFIAVGARLLRPVMDLMAGAEGVMAVETMASSPRRTASTVIALMIGLSFVFSNGSFIQSQKTALNRSLDRAVSADVLVSSSNEVHSLTYHFNEETANRIKSLPGVAVADALRIASVEYKGEKVAIISHEMASWFEIAPDLLDSGDLQAALESTARGDGMLVSNNFSARWNVQLGDRITLDTPSGPLTLTVVGMLDYYRSELGTVFFDRSLYKKYWGDTDVDYVFIDLKPGAGTDAFKNGAQSVIHNEQMAFVYTHEEYKRWVSTIIDQFFAMLYVQMLIAFFVASIGLINTMVISVAERRREIGVFRAIGALRRQVVKLVLLESIAIAIIGFAAGLISGVLNAYYLVNVAARIIAGYSLPLVFPLWMVIAAIPIVILIAIGSASFPARNAARLNVVEAIGYE